VGVTRIITLLTYDLKNTLSFLSLLNMTCVHACVYVCVCVCVCTGSL